MYEEFFGLRARPFGITPSVDLFFHSSAHRRALACLSDQVLAGAPLVVLIGNIGAGKTTVLQALLRDLPDGFAPAMVVSTQLDEIELTRSVLLAFGATAAGESQEDVRAALRYHLEGLRSRGQRGVLVVDEAQNFPAATLRYLLQLVGLGIGNEEASLQAIISGQPGLEPLLLEAAGERAGRELPLCRLGPLNMMDTGSYVRHRLRAVGTTGGPTFSEDALDLVRVATGGLPRLVNRLCDRVLVSAFLDRTRDIDLRRVARVAAELRDELDESDAPFPPFGDHEPAHAPPTTLSVESPPWLSAREPIRLPLRRKHRATTPRIMPTRVTQCLREKSVRHFPVPTPAAAGGSSAGQPRPQQVSSPCPSAGSSTTNPARAT